MGEHQRARDPAEWRKRKATFSELLADDGSTFAGSAGGCDDQTRRPIAGGKTIDPDAMLGRVC